ncbi:MAG: Tripartite tricarboxylate transporter TctB family [Clostridia bacterium]|nr:Tripartite tricarboxylate transporter TctB family [Clostridia bacterium]
MKDWKDWAFLTGFLAFALFLTISSWDYPFIVAIYPRLLLICGFVLSGLKIAFIFKNKSEVKVEVAEAGPGGSENRKYMWIYLACGILYMLLMPVLGFILSTFVTMIVLLGLFRIEFKTALPVAVGTPLILYVIFVIALEIPLPKGIVENLLF